MSLTQTWALPALVLALVSLTVDPVPPGPPALVQQQGNASAAVFAAKGANGAPEVRLSGVMHVTLSVEGTPPLEVEPAQPVTDSPTWNVREASAAVTVPLPDGRVRWRQRFALIPLDKGEQPLPLAPLRYREQTGDWHTANWKPIPVTVTTAVRRADLGEARDITDIEHLPPVRSWWDWALGALAVLIVAALAVGAWRLLRRWRRGGAPLTAAQLALRELDRLTALKLPEAGKVERFHTLLSNILRHYFEKRFQIPARRQTTTEFLEALRQAPELSAAQQALLRDFLERCDLAKFAGVTPAPAACHAAADMARTLVEQTAAPVPPPASAGSAPTAVV
jgi:hypothetical protein